MMTKSNKSFRLLLILIALFYEATAQETLSFNVCPSNTTFEYTSTTSIIPESDHGVCTSGTDVMHDLDDPANLVDDIQVIRNGSAANARPLKVNIVWNSGNLEGTIVITAKYKLYRLGGFLNTECHGQDWVTVAVYTINKRSLSPGGELNGGPIFTKSSDGPMSVSLTYEKGSTYPFELNEMHYSVNGVLAQSLISLTEEFTLTRDLNFGDYTFTTEFRNHCGDWKAGPEKVISVKPTCYDDEQQNVSRTIIGTLPAQPTDVDGYRLRMGYPYNLVLSGVHDVYDNYVVDFGDGLEDFFFLEDQFAITKEIGSYRVTFTKKNDRETCPDIPALRLFVGGEDLSLFKDCPIILPDILTTLQEYQHVDEIVRNHFSAKIESKSYIEVRPGVTLDLGAELELIPGPGEPTDDLVKNFIETTGFDDYGRVLSSSRAYFDDLGKHVQTQSKNLSAGVVLASQTIYDALGRSAISTLPAPISVRVRDDEEAVVGCAENAEEGLNFGYKVNFVTEAGGTPYTHRNFDNDINSPDPVDNSEPGTLGWYYSTNNGNEGDDEDLNESLTPASGYPYSRTIWNEVTGTTKSVTAPGDAFRAGGGNVTSTDVTGASASDPLLDSYFGLYEAVFGTRPSSLADQFGKTEVIDQDENKSVVYADKGGKAIISVYYGLGSTPITVSFNVYDNAGRLVVSVPPAGVKSFIDSGGTNYNAIEKTTYTYNHKGWLLSLMEPSTGLTKYMYRKDGKIRFSQNAKQALTGAFSFTNYDRAGRPFESGELHPGASPLIFDSEDLKDILENVSSTGGLPNLEDQRRFVTSTIYDLPASSLIGSTDAQQLVDLERSQRFVQGAISCSYNNNVTTWYSYDELGRIEWVVQQFKDEDLQPAEKIKTLDYRYGPTGALQEVVYQKDVEDERFTHFYEYDFDGRLKKTYTSRELLAYDRTGELTNSGALVLQSTQSYYKHGPLKRVVYANDLQGIDYVYTITGALKSINDADKDNDPGEDGTDVFGMTLEYYSGDYATNGYVPTSANLTSESNSYSGLIKGNTWHSPVDGNRTVGYGYTYDNRNQFKNARWTDPDVLIPAGAYKENVPDYDLNGNILQLNRNNRLGQSMAAFSYNYNDKPNQLTSITDAGSPFRSYSYNEIGQMTEQVDEVNDESLRPSYDVAGRIIELKDGDDHLIAKYEYDDRGFRLSKTSYNDEQVPSYKTWYVRDASGSVIGNYEKNIQTATPVTLTELPIYSGNRIGMYKPQYDLNFYEIQDHLGNVRAVIGGEFTQEYLATMEDSRVNVNAESDFSGITPSSSASFINYTPASVTVNGTEFTPSPRTKVIRVNNGVTHQPIGGGIMLWVHPKDKIDASVHVKYQNFNSSNTTAVTGVASYLATAFGGLAPVVDNVSLFDGVNSKLGVFAPLATVDETQPKAFLTYILYDQYMTPVKAGHVQVTDAAKIPSFAPQFHTHEKLSLDDIEVEQEGFIFIYVSNESDQNMDVYFDDIYVAHTLSNIVAGGDYYPFGLEIQNRTITREEYRHGYQGQYSEKDKESGWNHFQLREYDPVVGRWMSTDPMGQFYSPYIGMGNYPVSAIDPNGGYSWFGAWIRNGLSAKGLVESDGEWGFTTSRTYDESGVTGVEITSHFGDERRLVHELDPSTVGNLFFTYGGGWNPKNYDGTYNYELKPQNISDQLSYYHDIGYDAKGANGGLHLVFNRSVLHEDANFVSGQLSISKAYISQFRPIIGGGFIYTPVMDPITQKPLTFRTGINALISGLLLCGAASPKLLYDEVIPDVHSPK